MRHRKARSHLNRTSAHARAMVRNSVANLFRYERIRTTLSKAKIIRRWAEKMVTLGKAGTLHARRQALAFLRSKPAVVKLFRTLGPRYGERNGGYTRIIRLAEAIRPAGSDRVADFEPPAGTRLGDGTAMVILELVEAELTEREKRRRSAPEPFRPRRELYAERGAAGEAESEHAHADEEDSEAAPADEAADEATDEATDEVTEAGTETDAAEGPDESPEEGPGEGPEEGPDEVPDKGEESDEGAAE